MRTRLYALRFGSRVAIACVLASIGLLAWAEDPRPRLSQVSSNPISSFNPRRTPVVEVIEKVKGAVVNIHSERTLSSKNRDDLMLLTPTQNRVNGMGTGIIIDPRGYIITNHHVVDDVQTLRVRLVDGTTFPARVMARDPETDLALLKIESAKLLPTVPLGTASDLMVGETVIAIGNAFGYEHTASTGIVSALKRDVALNREVSYKSLIQTDASINPGNSGGPLLNIHGELVGVNVAIRAGAQGIGFAIPVDSMLKVAAELMSIRKRNGLAHGLALRDMVDSSTSPIRRWAIVEQCAPESAGAKAGIQVGDALEKIGDTKIICALDLERALLDKPIGEKNAVTVRRGITRNGERGQEVGLELVLKPADRPQVTTSNDTVWKKVGLRVQPVPAAHVSNVNPQLRGGLNILEVDPDSAAGKAGFLKGDILIGLHQWETISIDNAVFVLTHPELSTFSPLRFFVIRSGQLRRGFLSNLD